MTKIIHLAAKSRKNRMFFDNVIKDIAICINIGQESIDPDLDMGLPSYRGRNRRNEEGVTDIGNNHQAVGFDTMRQMLSPATVRAINDMLSLAKAEGLANCCDRRKISDFIQTHTDLTDCHLCTLNEMASLN